MSASAEPGARGRPRLVAAALATMVAVGVAAAVRRPAPRRDDDPAFDPERGVAVDAVLADPGRYVGEVITVTGTADLVTDDAMTLGPPDLIVIAADPGEESFERRDFFVGDRVRATGTLRIADARSIVRGLPDRSLLPSQFQGFPRQPVLLADDVAAA